MPTPNPEPSRRPQILDAAMRVFAREGAAGTKIQDIAREAGIAKGTIYLYFKSKEDIFESIIREHVGAHTSRFRQIQQMPVAPQQKVKALLEHLVSDTLSSPYPLDLMPELWTLAMRSEQKKQLAASVWEMGAVLAQLLDEAAPGRAGGLDHRKLADAFIALLHGAIILHVMDEQRFPMDELVAAMLDAVLRH